MLQEKDKESILFFKKSLFKVARLIFNYPNKTFHIRKLAKETGLSTTSIVRSVKELSKLERFKIIKIEKTDITTNIKANIESDSYKFYKKIFNLYRLERYLFIGELVEAFNAETIVLFGSFAKGEDVEDSDIDLLIITNQKEGRDVDDFLDTWEKELNRKINIQVLPSLDKSSPEFRNAIANGIVLYGYIKVI